VVRPILNLTRQNDWNFLLFWRVYKILQFMKREYNIFLYQKIQQKNKKGEKLYE
jgi:hypothetical protein